MVSVVFFITDGSEKELATLSSLYESSYESIDFACIMHSENIKNMELICGFI